MKLVLAAPSEYDVSRISPLFVLRFSHLSILGQITCSDRISCAKCINKLFTAGLPHLFVVHISSSIHPFKMDEPLAKAWVEHALSINLQTLTFLNSRASQLWHRVVLRNSRTNGTDGCKARVTRILVCSVRERARHVCRLNLRGSLGSVRQADLPGPGLVPQH